MLKASYKKHILKFKVPGKTSRETLNEKETWIVKIWEETNPSIIGIGECALFRGLSADDRPNFEYMLQKSCEEINKHENLLQHILIEWPSIRMGLETALKDLQNGGNKTIFNSPFVKGEASITINGLIWMGDISYMVEQIEEKLECGFTCLKLKIGALDTDKELALIEKIRKQYSQEKLQIRVDANGAFSQKKAMDVLQELKKLAIHSIEQPIRSGQFNAMRSLCQNTPVPIALDEELIGTHSLEKKEALLRDIRPQYIILKPSLLGGFSASQEWIDIAKSLDIGWWATSALESNIGLNAIAQWASSLNTSMPQGLGTGQLFTNNFLSPLYIKGQELLYNKNAKWEKI